jgi:hypothetical protein
VFYEPALVWKFIECRRLHGRFPFILFMYQMLFFRQPHQKNFKIQVMRANNFLANKFFVPTQKKLFKIRKLGTPFVFRRMTILLLSSNLFSKHLPFATNGTFWRFCRGCEFSMLSLELERFNWHAHTYICTYVQVGRYTKFNTVQIMFIRVAIFFLAQHTKSGNI